MNSGNINYDLRKVKAVTTLYHLCPLPQLEKWVTETQALRSKLKKQYHEVLQSEEASGEANIG